MKTSKRVLMVMAALCLVLLLIIPFPLTVLADDFCAMVFYSSESDSDLKKSSLDYLTAHDAASADSIPGGGQLIVGQDSQSGEWVVFRAGLHFDTSALPNGATITSAALILHFYALWLDTDFEITVVDGSVLSDPVTLSDYGALLPSIISGGSIDASVATAGNLVYHIPLNDTGLGWIDTDGWTKLGLRSSRDISAIPSGSEVVVLASRESSTETAPKLLVVYEGTSTQPGAVPPTIEGGSGKTVGGILQPVDKVGLLLPYITGAVVLLGLAAYLVRRRVRN